MYSNDWKAESLKNIERTYRNYKPRSDFLTNRKTDPKFSSGQAFNLAGFKNLDVASFTDLWLDNSKCNEITEAFQFFYEVTPKKKEHVCFVTFSSDFNSFLRCPTHVHNFIGKEPCFTTTYAITLYSGNKLPAMYVSKESKRWPKAFYFHPESIPNDIPMDQYSLSEGKVTKFQFNSSYRAHYVDYTDSIVAWLVIDGAEHNVDLAVDIVDSTLT